MNICDQNYDCNNQRNTETNANTLIPTLEHGIPFAHCTLATLFAINNNSKKMNRFLAQVSKSIKCERNIPVALNLKIWFNQLQQPETESVPFSVVDFVFRFGFLCAK